MASSAADVDAHLRDLRAIASATADAASGQSVDAKDVCTSLENWCKNALDDEFTGAAALLLDGDDGLPSILIASLRGARRNEEPVRLLRTELLNLVDWLLLETVARERPGHAGEYVCDIISACLHVFPLEISSPIRAKAIETLLVALELKEHVPDQARLRAILFPPAAQCDPVRNPSPVQLYWGHLSSKRTGSSDSVRGACLRVLGRLAARFPVLVADDPIYERGLLHRCCDDVLARRDAGMPEVQGALEALDGLLGEEGRVTPPQVAAAFGHALRRLDMRAAASGDD